MLRFVTSTTAKVKDAEKLKQVLNNYDLKGIYLLLDKECNHLTAIDNPYGDPNDPDWPQALPIDQIPSSPDDDEDKDAMVDWDIACDEVFYEKGGEGLIALLREVAPCLEEPLTFLALALVDGRAIAGVWIVQPGSTEVQTLEVSYDKAQELLREQFTEDLAAKVKAHAEEAQAFAMEVDAVHQMMVQVLAAHKKPEDETPISEE
jgi:hypothetical protein